MTLIIYLTERVSEDFADHQAEPVDHDPDLQRQREEVRHSAVSVGVRLLAKRWSLCLRGLTSSHKMVDVSLRNVIDEETDAHILCERWDAHAENWASAA